MPLSQPWNKSKTISDLLTYLFHLKRVWISIMAGVKFRCYTFLVLFLILVILLDSPKPINRISKHCASIIIALKADQKDYPSRNSSSSRRSNNNGLTLFWLINLSEMIDCIMICHDLNQCGFSFMTLKTKTCFNVLFTTKMN